MSGHDHGHATAAAPAARTPRYAPKDVVDFVIVGSGSAGGVMARELSRAGFRVVVLEQGPRMSEKDFTHDEIKIFNENYLTNKPDIQPQTYRRRASDAAKKASPIQYARLVGGGSAHWTANAWRLHPIDFKEASKVGTPAGTTFTDWPISYDDLEPYYTKAEWEIGVAGLAGASPFDPPRSRPYPMEPHPIGSTGVLMERGAKKLGWTAFPAPMAITSRPYRGRSGCARCGFCLGFGCEVRAKSSTLVSAIPDAEATGRCEVRPDCYVRKVEVNDKGLVTGVIYFDKQKREVFQRAKAVVLCANGAETPRLLFNSKSNRFPDGLANSSGMVGRNIMFNGNVIAAAQFEHEINAWKGPAVTRIIHDTYELDAAKVGFLGGGGFDFRQIFGPAIFPFAGMPFDGPQWGSAWKKELAHAFNRTLTCFGHTTSLPVADNRVDLDDTVKDAWGLPALRLTFSEHENDLKVYQWFADRAKDLLDAAGAVKSWTFPIGSPDPNAPQGGGPHLLGTCRMGKDPKASVVDPMHRAHDVPNLFMVDGSSLVTSSRGQPTLTIMALAFRAGDLIAQAAKRGEVPAGG